MSDGGVCPVALFLLRSERGVVVLFDIVTLALSQMVCLVEMPTNW